MAKDVILTGLRANNELHLGNYLGSLLPIVDLARQHQGKYQINLFVPDLHSFTTPIEHAELKAAIWQNLRFYVAAGLPLDQQDVHIYRQSYVPAHSELTWILDCFTGMGEMQRMTQFKDRAASLGTERLSVGLFNYPVLMAADILLYGAKYVPVGEDQTQHIEFARDIGERLNNRFGVVFSLPLSIKEQQAFFKSDQGVRIRDLAEPHKKMSKSSDSDKGVLFLTDEDEVIKQKVMAATTDSLGRINYDLKNQPGVSNLLIILALLTKRTLDDVRKQYEGQTSYGPLKEAVSQACISFSRGFKEHLDAVDDHLIEAKLKASEEQMNVIANQTLAKVQAAVGLR